MTLSYVRSVGRSPSVGRHSLSSSDCASLYSHEEATLLDSDTRDPASAPGSVPQLSLRRASIPARILVNPTGYPAPAPAPAKSLTHLKSAPCSPHHGHEAARGQRSKRRRRRRTEPAKSRSKDLAKSRSSHSVFDCEHDCFTVAGAGSQESRSQQFVFITTGPMVI